ncbi:hypothetical protein PAXRUDRAFT_22475 [Paxillus rubicundulus Ve08.2h10]|uniref:Uncharacterized protein n=1 Tax=Paxillus rubicundulus Ve08.2h10 TaxID=930991 RepID=A0A0D0CXF5_9AGAM|nr:hypothetical protein PAXRUDRAFT_22475 [Paxillus rubicundulus Ve08.2h10]
MQAIHSGNASVPNSRLREQECKGENGRARKVDHHSPSNQASVVQDADPDLFEHDTSDHDAVVNVTVCVRQTGITLRHQAQKRYGLTNVEGINDDNVNHSEGGDDDDNGDDWGQQH